jgi:hypothetical protein
MLLECVALLHQSLPELSADEVHTEVTGELHHWIGPLRETV